jgi:methylmalonyl-CoA mutase N-terminal domain/subunit
LEEEALRLLGKVDDLGGMRAAIEQGWPQREIQASAYRWQREVEERRRLLVGVNAFTGEDAPAPELHRIDPAVERRLAEQVRAHRAGRDARACEATLHQLQRAAEGEANLLDPILAAARAGATTGEICGALRAVFGEFRAPAEV